MIFYVEKGFELPGRIECFLDDFIIPHIVPLVYSKVKGGILRA